MSQGRKRQPGLTPSQDIGAHFAFAKGGSWARARNKEKGRKRTDACTQKMARGQFKRRSKKSRTNSGDNPRKARKKKNGLFISRMWSELGNGKRARDGAIMCNKNGPTGEAKLGGKWRLLDANTPEDEPRAGLQGDQKSVERELQYPDEDMTHNWVKTMTKKGRRKQTDKRPAQQGRNE